MNRIPAILVHPIYLPSGRLAAAAGPVWIELSPVSCTTWIYSSADKPVGQEGSLLYTMDDEDHPWNYLVITSDRLANPGDLIPDEAGFKNFKKTLDKASRRA
jgi:hypothetical protein